MTLEREIEERTGYETRVTILGHVQRGGTPVAFDRVLGTRFGVAALQAVEAGRYGTMVALRGTEIVEVALEQALVAPKLLEPSLYETAALFFGNRGRVFLRLARGRLLVVSAEALAHRRLHTIGEVVRVAGCEPPVERCGEDRDRHPLLDCRDRGPAALPQSEIRRRTPRALGTAAVPRRSGPEARIPHAAPSPNLGHLSRVDLEPVVLGML